MFGTERRELVFLLKRCAADDKAAQEEFANRSFLGTVQLAVTEVIDGYGSRELFTQEDINSLVAVCVWEGVYLRADKAVRRAKEFRRDLRDIAAAIATKYIQRKLMVRQSW